MSYELRSTYGGETKVVREFHGSEKDQAEGGSGVNNDEIRARIGECVRLEVIAAAGGDSRSANHHRRGADLLSHKLTQRSVPCEGLVGKPVARRCLLGATSSIGGKNYCLSHLRQAVRKSVAGGPS